MESGSVGMFSVGHWRVEPDLNRISLGSQTTTLRPQVMELLVYLARQDGRVVSAHELLDHLWTGKVVTDNAVYNCVAELRHALTDDKDATPYVETVPKKGYRLLAPVDGLHGDRKDKRQGSSLLAWRTVVIAAASASVAVIAWLSIPRQMPADIQAVPSQPIPSSAANTAQDHRVSTGHSRLRLSLSLPRYADQSQSYGWPSIALSPDGRQIAYIGFDGGEVYLYLKRDDDAQARRIVDTAGSSAPFFSPAGDWVGYFAGGKIKRVHTDGGKAVDIGLAPGPPTGASWSEDNYIYFAVGYRSFLQRIPDSGGAAEAVTTLPGQGYTHRRPHALPGGQSFLYQSGAQSSIMQSEPAEIWLFDRRTGQRKFLIEGANPKYSNGALIFQRAEAGGRSIWQIGFDLDRMVLLGDPEPLITTPVEDFDVSRSGAVLYVHPRALVKNILRLTDSRGTRELYASDEPISHPRFSPDDHSLAVSIGGKNKAETWLFDLTGNKTPAQLTTDTGGFHTWSPQGSRIAYYRWTEGIFAQTVHEPGSPERLVDLAGFLLPLDWTTDGLLFLQPDPYAKQVLFYQADDGSRRPVTVEGIVPLDAKISPNGQWLVYSRMNAGHPDVVVKEFPVGQRHWRVSGNLAADHPKWSADGRTLYFESFNRLMAVSVDYGGPISFGQPREVLGFSGRSDITLDTFDVSHVHPRFAIVDTIYGDPPQHIYVSDWRELLPAD